MDAATWHGKIYLDGWTQGSGGDAPVRERATGAELGRIGIATGADVARAASIAAAAQVEWAARPHYERAAILRRAGDLLLEHAADIHSWIIRETGSVPPKAGLETHVGSQECYEASTLPSPAYGELFPSAAPRLAIAP